MAFRITPAEALKHPRRIRLATLVRERPGLTFRQVVKSSGIPAGSCMHHLGVLRRCGLVAVEPDGHAMRHFAADADPDARLAATLQRTGLEDVYAWLAVHGPVNQKAILDAMPHSRSTTQHRVKRLVDRGLVEERRQGRRCVYRLPDS